MQKFVITSPSGNTLLSVCLSNEGVLTYTVSQDGVLIVEESAMGLSTGIGDFTSGLHYVSEDDQVIQETYRVLSGKRRVYTNHCNEKSIHLEKDGIGFDLVTRAYNDGVAFRYVITTADEVPMTIEPNAETTNFKLPHNARMWSMNRRDPAFMYEDNYVPGKIGETECGIQPTLPMLYETNGKYALIMEADRHGNYVGSLLRLEENGVMQMIFDLVQTMPVQTKAPFTSPWRTLIIGSPADILQNTMVENLSPAPDPKYDFESWVVPGLSSWSWVSYYGGQEDPEIHKHFIDLAADMGWTYYILDERWQPENKTGETRYIGMWDWFKDVKEHADKRGVKLFAWVDKKDVAKREHRIARFKEWSEAGIVGIKVDFFFNDSQEMMQLYDDIYRDAADYRLMVNPHGSNPPSGEIRTYPNSLSREAIRGQEQGGITVQQYTLIPFLRSAVGTADVTEQLYSRDVNKTTMGFQIALSTLIENGLHSMGSKPEEYYSVPAAIDLYTNFPKSWDDLYVIDAEVGVVVNLARQCGNTWYAAGISVDARTFSYKPAFLDPSKTYTAVIYHEKNGERQALDMRVQQNVTSETTLSVDVQAGGGYTIKFVEAGVSDLRSISASATDITVETYYSADVSLTLDPVDTKSAGVLWTVADPDMVKLSFTAKGATIRGLKAGETTVTASSIYDADKKAVIHVTVLPPKYRMDDTTWTVLNDTANYVISGENEVSITAETGVLSKNVFAMKAPTGDFEISAKISGELNANWQGGFIGAFTDELEGSFAAIGRRYHTNWRWQGAYPHSHISMMGNRFEKHVQNPIGNGAVLVRLVKHGSTFTGYWKLNENDAWVAFEDGVFENEALASSDTLHVGFFTGCGGSTNNTTVTISDFCCNGRAVPVAVRTR